MAEEFKESEIIGSRAKQPGSGIRDMEALGQRATPTQVESPVIDDPIQLFKESVKSGVKNLQANNDLFRGAVASVMGNEVASENLVNQAQINQAGGASYLNNIESFEQFLDQPTFGGFIDQAISATGQFVPSAVASIGTAMAGAAVGALAGASAPLTLGAVAAGSTRATAGLAAQGLTKKEATNLINKYVARKSKEAAAKNPKYKNVTLPPKLKPEEEELVETLFKKIRQDSYIKKGLVVGAFGQEYPQGAGIAFGNYAEQDMTDPVAAFKSLAGFGPAYASIGVLSEAAVAKSVAKVFRAKPDKASKDIADQIEKVSFGEKVGAVAATSAVSETLAEGAQEEISIQQKLSIDDSYTEAQAQLDRYQAYFSGFFGGLGVGGGIGTATAAGSNLLTPETISKANQSASNVATKSKDLLKQAYEFVATKEAEENQMEGATPGQVVPEPQGWLTAQIRMMLNPATNKKAVWVDKDTPFDAVEISKSFPTDRDRIFISQASPLGALYTLDPNLINDFEDAIQTNPSDNTLVDQFLANTLGYSKTKGLADGYIVEIRDNEGNLAWYQQTDLEGIENAKNAANRVIGGGEGYTVEVQSIEDHFNSRMQSDADASVSFMTLAEELADSPTADPIMLIRYQTLLEKARKGGGLDSLTEQERETLRSDYQGLLALDETPSSGFAPPSFGEDLDKSPILTDQEALIEVSEDSFLGSQTKPILNINKKDFRYTESQGEAPGVGWAENTPKTQITLSSLKSYNDLKSEVKEILPKKTKLGQDMEKALDSNLYSESLLNAYLKLHSDNFSQRIFSEQLPLLAIIPAAINAKGQQTYGIVRLKTPSGESNILSGLDLQKATRLAINKEEAFISTKKNYTPTGWKIRKTGINPKTKEKYKYSPVYMPDLVSLGMSLRMAQREQDTTPTNIAGLALNGFSEIYQGLREAGYEFTTNKDAKVFVIPRAQGEASSFTLNDLRKRRNELYFNPEIDETNSLVKNLERRLDKLSKARSAAAPNSPAERQANSAFFTTLKQLQEERKKLNTLIESEKELVKQNERATSPLMEERINYAKQRAEGVRSIRYDERGNPVLSVEVAEGEQQLEGIPAMSEFQSYNVYELGRKERPAPPTTAPKLTIQARDLFSPELREFLPESTIKDLSAITQRFKKQFKILKGITVVSASEDLNANKLFPSNQAGIESFKKIVSQTQEEVRNTPEKPAAVVQTRDAAVIILRADPFFSASSSLGKEESILYREYAHELGHILLEQERYNSLRNPQTSNLLYEAFLKERDETQEPAYMDPGTGYDEWYSDKFAARFLDKKQGLVLGERETNRVTLYFNRLVKKLSDFYEDVKKIFKERFEQNYTYNEYLDGVVKSYKQGGILLRPNAANIIAVNYMEKSLKEHANKIASPEALRKIQNQVKQAINANKVPPALSKILFTAHGVLSGLGKAKGTGKKMADILYSQSSTTDHRGLLNVKTTTVERYLNGLQKALGDEKLTEVGQKEIEMFIAHELLNDLQVSDEALLEAYNNNTEITLQDGRTAKLEEIINPEYAPNVIELRKFYKKLYKEQDLASQGISEREYYSTVSYDIPALYNSAFLQSALISALIVANKGVTFERPAVDRKGKEIPGQVEKYQIDTKEATKTVVGMLARGLGIVEFGAKTDGFHYGLARNRAEHFKRIQPSMLRNVVDTSINAGLLKSPDIAALEYINAVVKRTEYNKRGGADLMDSLYKELPPEERSTALAAFNAMIGRVPSINNSVFRNLNSAGLVFNTVTLLGLSTFASFPDLGGAVLRSKEMNTGIKGIGKVIQQLIIEGKEGREEAGELIRALGVAGTEGIASYYINAAESDFLHKKGKKITEKFFKYIGLEHFTRFTRVVAAIMGKHFLDVHANRALKGDKRSIRYLNQLEITPEEYFTWKKLPKAQQNEFATSEGIAVRDALTQFVEESVIRPNAAERPIYGSDPRFALVFQLKGFFYAYGKNIVGGTFREMSDRYKEGEGVTQASFPLLLAAMTLLPLTALGFDLRERFKVGLDWLLPFTGPNSDSGLFESSGKNYRRSLDMDYGEYTFELFDRSGFLGPVALAMPLFMQSKRYGDPFFVSPLGPTFEKIYQFGSGDLNFKDIIPVYSNL